MQFFKFFEAPRVIYIAYETSDLGDEGWLVRYGAAIHVPREKCDERDIPHSVVRGYAIDRLRHGPVGLVLPVKQSTYMLRLTLRNALFTHGCGVSLHRPAPIAAVYKDSSDDEIMAVMMDAMAMFARRHSQHKMADLLMFIKEDIQCRNLESAKGRMMKLVKMGMKLMMRGFGAPRDEKDTIINPDQFTGGIGVGTILNYNPFPLGFEKCSSFDDLGPAPTPDTIAQLAANLGPVPTPESKADTIKQLAERTGWSVPRVKEGIKDPRGSGLIAALEKVVLDVEAATEHVDTIPTDTPAAPTTNAYPGSTGPLSQLVRVISAISKLTGISIGEVYQKLSDTNGGKTELMTAAIQKTVPALLTNTALWERVKTFNHNPLPKTPADVISMLEYVVDAIEGNSA